MFQRGVIQPGGGRPKGSINKATKAMKEFTRKLVESPTYRLKLKKQLEARTLEPAIEQMLWHYAYGKPKETLDVSWNLEGLSDTELSQLEQLVRRAS